MVTMVIELIPICTSSHYISPSKLHLGSSSNGYGNHGMGEKKKLCDVMKNP